MSKISSAKYYQYNKRKTTKKGSQKMSKKEKKPDSMVVSDTKTYQKMKNKSLFRIEKNIK